MKRCSKCHQDKERVEFHKYSRSKDGLAAHCRACAAIKSRKYYERNKEAVNARSLRRYYSDHETNKVKRRTRMKAWRVANHDLARAKDRANYVRNGDQIRKRSREYIRSHPETVKANSHKRRARRLSAPGSFTKEEWLNLCESYGWKCLCCGIQTKRLSVDHVVPLARGGSNYLSNIQCLCRPCNSKKHLDICDYRPQIANDNAQPTSSSTPAQSQSNSKSHTTP